MGQQANYLGFALFWLYNVAALFFTGLVIYTIITLPVSNKTNVQQHSRDVAIFSALACISFMTLSYNMLGVLIQSFFIWNQYYSVSEAISAGDIWKWSIESTLFQDFGEAIVATTTRKYWTIAALIGTMSVCLFIGAEGHRRQIPRLWAFFCLSQVLPISFTQNLFYVALLRMPTTAKQVAVPKHRIYFLFLAYRLSTFGACSGSSWLLPFIITTRVLLFAPLILTRSRETGSSSDVVDNRGMQEMLRSNATQTIGLIIGQRMTKPSTDEVSLQTIQQALFAHPAVSSLGCDLLLCVLSFGIWTLTSRTRRATDVDGDSKIKE